jgi:glycosyltransferase involved in cell wall biosynthesis
MYRGGFGQSNDIKAILDSAKILESRGHNHIKLVLAGEGSGKQEMVQYARYLGLSNVEFQAFVPKDQLPDALARADALLCSLPGVPHFQKYGQIASKLIDYLSAGRPILIATNIPENLVEMAQAGIVVPPGEPIALAQAIEHLAALSPEARARMGRNGLDYVRRHHDIAMLAERLEGALAQSCREHAQRGS